MSKELEKLENLSNQEIIVKKGIGIYMDGSVQTMLHKTTVGVEFKGDIESLQQALQHLEAIKNAKPSEALELVGYLKDHHLNTIPYYDWLNDIEKYILKTQEQETDIIHYKETIANLRKDNALLKDIKNKQDKMIKIIKKKNVDINYLRYEAVNVKMYNDYISQLNKVSTINHSSLDDEEFNLLKEF